MVVGTDPWWVWVWVWAQIPMGIPTQGPNGERIKALLSELSYVPTYVSDCVLCIGSS